MTWATATSTSTGQNLSTPNIDRLAAQGVRFTNWTSANPVCSPSRASLLTGRYPTRVGVPRVLNANDKTGLNLDEQTLADLLKARGYRTQCVGKWHLGVTPEYLPTKRGFDHYLGIPYSNDMTPSILMRDEQIIEQPVKLETLTQRYTDEATKFIRDAAGSPFFLYFPHTFPHIPLAASPRFRGKSPEGIYGDTVAELDWSVGEVMNTLQSAGVASNTLVLFSSDNGPWYQGSPGKLRGRKGETWEGGVREPFIAWMPAHIPKGRVSSAVGSMLDVVPTITKLCGAAPPAKPLDGLDAWPLFTGAVPQIDREPLLYFDDTHLQCARWQQWKLHVSRYNHRGYSPAPAGGNKNLLLPHPELYDLEIDPDESYDVADMHPAIVSQMIAKIEAQMKTFPENIVQDWEITKQRKVSPTAAGALPRNID
ncbi:MAG TPA: sulfatase [Bryobacteraceae bacterium]|nr:sulfatase [Bryobacteraceae bacterium]